MGRLGGRRSVIIGAGSAIGRACARRFHAEGAELLLVDASAEDLARIEQDSPGVRTLAVPVSSPDSADEIARHCRDLWEAVDVLVICCSAMETWPQEEDTLALAQQVLTDTIMPHLAYTMAMDALLRASAHGAVVYLGSIDGLRGNPQVPAYSLGKAGLVPLTHIMAQKLGTSGVRVNCIAAAGIAQTSPSIPIDRDVGDANFALRLTPLGRMPDAGEIASVALFLASDDASYVTGAMLPVDGGRIACTPGTW